MESVFSSGLLFNLGIFSNLMWFGSFHCHTSGLQKSIIWHTWDRVTVMQCKSYPVRFHADKPERKGAHAKSSSRDIWIPKKKVTVHRGVVSVQCSFRSTVLEFVCFGENCMDLVAVKGLEMSGKPHSELAVTSDSSSLVLSEEDQQMHAS